MHGRNHIKLRYNLMSRNVTVQNTLVTPLTVWWRLSPSGDASHRPALH